MPVTARPLSIPDVLVFEPGRFGDARGSFSETWSRRDWAAAGLDADFVQDNHAHSVRRGVLRGLHFQISPHAQGKLVRVVLGSAMDVAVDIRPSSPTFGDHVAVELSAENGLQMWIPPGFAHGYVTLEDDTHVLYKTTDYYAPDFERGVRWNDPALAIDWRVPEREIVVNERDRAFPALAEFTAKGELAD